MSRRFVYFQGKTLAPSATLFLEARTEIQDILNAATYWECTNSSASIFYEVASEVGYASGIFWYVGSRSPSPHFYVVVPKEDPILPASFTVTAIMGGQQYSKNFRFPENRIDWPITGQFSGASTFPFQYFTLISASEEKHFGVNSTGTFLSPQWSLIAGGDGPRAYPPTFPMLMTPTRTKTISSLYAETGIGFDTFQGDDVWRPDLIHDQIMHFSNDISIVASGSTLYYYDFSLSNTPTAIEFSNVTNPGFSDYFINGIYYDISQSIFYWVDFGSFGNFWDVLGDSSPTMQTLIRTAAIDFANQTLVPGTTFTATVQKPPTSQANVYDWPFIFQARWAINPENL